VWVYSHLLLLIAVAAVGVGIEVGILHENLSQAERWLIGGSVAGTLAVLAILHLCSGRPAKAAPRLVGAALCVAAAMFAGESGSLLLLGILAAVVAAQVGLELVRKARVVT